MKDQNKNYTIKILVLFTLIFVGFQFYWIVHLLKNFNTGQEYAFPEYESQQKSITISLGNNIINVTKSGINTFRLAKVGSNAKLEASTLDNIMSWFKSPQGLAVLEQEGMQPAKWSKVKIKPGDEVNLENINAKNNVYELPSGEKVTFQDFQSTVRESLPLEKKIPYLPELNDTQRQEVQQSTRKLADWWNETYPQVSPDGKLQNYLGGSSTPSILAQSEGKIGVLDRTALPEIKIAREVELSDEARKALSDFTRPIGDIDFVNVNGNPNFKPSTGTVSLQDIPETARGAFSGKNETIVYDALNSRMNGPMNVLEATVGGQKYYVVDPVDVLGYKTLGAPTSNLYSDKVKKYNTDFEKIYKIAEEMGYSKEELYNSTREMFKNYLKDNDSTELAKQIDNLLDRTSVSPQLQNWLKQFREDPELFPKIPSPEATSLSKSDAEKVASASAIAALSWSDDPNAITEPNGSTTGSDGLQHKLDENGNPVLFNSQTQKWEADNTPDAVISQPAYQEPAPLPVSSEPETPLDSGFRMAENINDTIMMTPAALGIGTALLGGSDTLAALSPGLVAANAAVATPALLVAGGLAWGKVGYEVYKDTTSDQFLIRDLPGDIKNAFSPESIVRLTNPQLSNLFDQSANQKVKVITPEEQVGNGPVTGKDGLQHRLDENGNPIVQDPTTGEWKPDTTKDAVIAPPAQDTQAIESTPDYRTLWEKIAPESLGGKTKEDKFTEITAQKYEEERTALEKAQELQRQELDRQEQREKDAKDEETAIRNNALGPQAPIDPSQWQKTINREQEAPVGSISDSEMLDKNTMNETLKNIVEENQKKIDSLKASGSEESQSEIERLEGVNSQLRKELEQSAPPARQEEQLQAQENSVPQPEPTNTDSIVQRLAEKESYLTDLKQYEKDTFESLYGNGEDKRGLAVDQVGNRAAQQWGVDTDVQGNNFGRKLDDYEKDWAGRQADWLKEQNNFTREQLESNKRDISQTEDQILQLREELKNTGMTDEDISSKLNELRSQNPELKDPSTIERPGFIDNLKADFLNAANDSDNVAEFVKNSLQYVSTDSDSEERVASNEQPPSKGMLVLEDNLGYATGPLGQAIKTALENASTLTEKTTEPEAPSEPKAEEKTVQDKTSEEKTSTESSSETEKGQPDEKYPQQWWDDLGLMSAQIVSPDEDPGSRVNDQEYGNLSNRGENATIKTEETENPASIIPPQNATINNDEERAVPAGFTPTENESQQEPQQHILTADELEKFYIGGWTPEQLQEQGYQFTKEESDQALEKANEIRTENGEDEVEDDYNEDLAPEEEGDDDEEDDGDNKDNNTDNEKKKEEEK